MKPEATKQRLADALKTCTETSPLNKITIEMITETAAVTRNTFYYHFEDIHALLEWTLDNDVIIQLRQYTKVSRWQDGYQLMLNYVTQNRHFCLQCFKSLDWQLLEDFLTSVARQMVEKVVVDVDPNVDLGVKEALVNFYGGALVMQLVLWLTNDLKETTQTLMTRAEVSLNGTFESVLADAKKN